eukprot:1136345-Pelagomonas_calceolata.AAC.4
MKKELALVQQQLGIELGIKGEGLKEAWFISSSRAVALFIVCQPLENTGWIAEGAKLIQQQGLGFEATFWAKGRSTIHGVDGKTCGGALSFSKGCFFLCSCLGHVAAEHSSVGCECLCKHTVVGCSRPVAVYLADFESECMAHMLNKIDGPEADTCSYINCFVACIVVFGTFIIQGFSIFLCVKPAWAEAILPSVESQAILFRGVTLVAKQLPNTSDARLFRSSTCANGTRRAHEAVMALHTQTGVHETSKEFLKRLSTRLQEESINWNQRHDDDLQAKDRDLEVRPILLRWALLLDRASSSLVDDQPAPRCN